MVKKCSKFLLLKLEIIKVRGKRKLGLKWEKVSKWGRNITCDSRCVIHSVFLHYLFIPCVLILFSSSVDKMSPHCIGPLRCFCAIQVCLWGFCLFLQLSEECVMVHVLRPCLRFMFAALAPITTSLFFCLACVCLVCFSSGICRAANVMSQTLNVRVCQCCK